MINAVLYSEQVIIANEKVDARLVELMKSLRITPYEAQLLAGIRDLIVPIQRNELGAFKCISKLKA